MSTLKVNNLVTKGLEDDLAFKTNNTTRMVLTSAGTLSGNTTGFLTQPGMVLQVINVVESEAFTTTTGDWRDVMSIAITPTSTSSKILVTANINAAGYDEDWRVAMRLERDGTAIDDALGDAAGSRGRATQADRHSGDTGSMIVFSVTYLDSPATVSEVTYSSAVIGEDGSYHVNINKNPTDSDSATYFRSACFMTLMEIAG